MFKEAIIKIKTNIRQSISDTFKLLWQFKGYIMIYMVPYLYYSCVATSASKKHYFIWQDWHPFDRDIYLGTGRLLLTIVTLLFFLAISNMRNHPLLAKIILLSTSAWMTRMITYG